MKFSQNVAPTRETVRQILVLTNLQNACEFATLPFQQKVETYDVSKLGFTQCLHQYPAGFCLKPREAAPLSLEHLAPQDSLRRLNHLPYDSSANSLAVSLRSGNCQLLFLPFPERHPLHHLIILHVAHPDNSRAWVWRQRSALFLRQLVEDSPSFLQSALVRQT